MKITPEEKERLIDLEMAQFRANLRAKESAANLAAVDAASQATVQAALEGTKPAFKVTRLLTLGIRRILATLVAAGIGAALLLLLANRDLASLRDVHFSPVTQPIALGQTNVRANGYVDYKIEIVSGMKEAVVSGNFKVSGDPGAGIASAIANAGDYANWVKGRGPEPNWQRSGPTGSGTIEAHLGPGAYYLVFSNRFPPPSEKRVVLDVRLKYLSAPPDGQGRQAGK
jgi:hypothetical protein